MVPKLKIKNRVVLVVVVIVIIGAIIYLDSMKAGLPAPTRPSDKNGSLRSSGPQQVPATEAPPVDGILRPKAPELAGIKGYINAPEGFTLAGLRGKVVIVDFWTYTCINCIRTQPYLNAWYDAYHDFGLEIVGVHTPEFEFEKLYANVAAAVVKEGIKYPVVLDSDYSTWRAYRNQYWPHKYLLDQDGVIRYDQIGEGGYEEFEEQIRALLGERNATLAVVDEANVTGAHAVGRIGTPEIYFGYGFNRGNFGTYVQIHPEDAANYSLPAILQFNEAYLEGRWVVRKDYAQLLSPTGKIVLAHSSKATNIVAGAEQNVSLRVLIDGKLISASISGSDVANGAIVIAEERLYSAVIDTDSRERTIELDVIGPGLRIYTFTFG